TVLPATAEALADAVDTLLRLGPADPDRRVRDLLADSTRYVESVAEDRVDQLVMAACRRTPGAIAVEAGATRTTYAELAAGSRAVARALRLAGVQPGDRVGIRCERSIAEVIAVVGVLAAGAALVPLTPRLSTRHAVERAEAAGVDVIVAGPDLPDLDLPDLDLPGVTTIRVHQDGSGADIRRPADDDRDGGGDDPAYVMFTSGSTGAPKPVLNTHRPLAQRLRWGAATYPLAESDGVLHHTALDFDPSLLEILWPLTVGARVVIAPAEADVVELVATIRRHRVSVLDVVPALLTALVDEPSSADLGDLRLVFCGGGVLRPDLAHRALARWPITLVNAYGPTEVTIDVAHNVCGPGPYSDGVPIGYPVAGAELEIVDDDLNPVPPGEPGELVVAGSPLAVGYLGRPEETATAFRAHPRRPGERLYRTGDRARQRSDGAVMFLGRIDHQIKVRGYRIEPGEVENVLRQSDLVTDVVVTTRSGRDGDPELVALVVSALPDLDEVEVQAGLAEHVVATAAAHLAPAVVHLVQVVPRQVDGELDRVAASRIAGQLPRGPMRDTGSPWDGAESLVAQVWSEVLGGVPVGRRTSFVAAGGDSLDATRVCATLRRAAQAHITVAEVLRSDLRTLARLIEDRSTTPSTTSGGRAP
ncbi:MAG: non-ribosomal peptide synthetase, partial [Nocardioides sp.]